MYMLLYVGQIVVGLLVLVAALALSGRLPARFRTPSVPVPGYADVEVTGSPCRFGIFFAVAAIGFGVAGLAGLSTLPSVIGVLVTGMGLISVLLSTDTTPMTYRVTDDALSVTAMPPAHIPPAHMPPARVPTRTEVVAIPSRVRPSTRRQAA